MNNIYINIKDFGELYIGEYLENKFGKDLISVDELIGVIEDLLGEVDSYKEKFEELTENNEYDEYDEFDDKWHSGVFH